MGQWPPSTGSARQSSADSVARWIWRYLHPYRGRVAALLALSSLEVLFRVLSPWPVKVIVDHVLGSTPPPAWLQSVMRPFTTVAGFIAGEREQMLVAFVGAGLSIRLVHQS